MGMTLGHQPMGPLTVDLYNDGWNDRMRMRDLTVPGDSTTGFNRQQWRFYWGE